jgi:hypothetical protein
VNSDSGGEGKGERCNQSNIFCLSARNREKKRTKRLGSVQPSLCSVWHTRLSGGAPDSARCARLDSGEQAALGRIWPRTTIIHRTVRWCTGLSGEPTAASATVGHAIHGRRVARANGRQGALDYPVYTGQCLVRQTVTNLQRSAAPELEGDRAPDMNSGCPVVHQTVRCATRQKARIAFLRYPRQRKTRRHRQTAVLVVSVALRVNSGH